MSDFHVPDLMTIEEVMNEVQRYFDSGHGNPRLAEPILSHIKRTGQIPHAVMTTFKLERVTMYRRKL
jgi:hypothetical protein